MPAISKIRYTNVIYENGGKRYIDNVFQFEGYNGIILLENGGGKTVFIQTLIQAVLPHAKVAGRRINDTLVLNNNIAHIAVEWILNDQPRRYAVTAVSLFINNREQVASYQFVNEYGPGDKERIEEIPFVKMQNGQKRAAGKEEIAEYYRTVGASSMTAKFFGENETLTAYGNYLEKNLQIIPSEWAKIATINMSEGGVEEYFAKCDTTGALVDRLLIPTVEEALAGGGSCDFVDLFEKQRIHFQKQLQLSARIQELNQVVTDLRFYNQRLKEYHDTALLLDKQKTELKSLNHFVRNTQTEKVAAEEAQKQQLQELQTAQTENERSKAALAVAFTAEKMQAAEREKVLAQKDRDTAGSAFSEKKARENDLRYAKLQQDEQQQMQIIAMTQTQLDELDRDTAIADINDRLEENGGALKGYFEDTEHRMNREIDSCKCQIKAAKETQQELLQKEVQCRQDLEGLKQKISSNDGQIKQIVDLLTKIEQDILDDSINESVEAQCPKWQERIERIGGETAKVQQLLQEYGDEKARYAQSIPKLTGDIHELNLQQSENKNKVQQVKAAAKSLITKLRELPVFQMLTDDLHAFYQREVTWQNLLEESVETLRRQKQDALAKERRACRQIDEYRGKEFFTADGALAENLPKWQEHFTLLESGTFYFQQARRVMQVSAEELTARFPYWAASVIIAPAEVEKVLRFLESKSELLTQAIIVLTEPEAREICEGKSWTLDGRQIVPARWVNIVPEKFTEWLGALQTEADFVSAEKERIEMEFQRQKQYLQELKSYYQQYTYAEYQELYAAKQEIENKIDVLRKHLENLTTGQTRIAQALENQEKRRQALADEHTKLVYRTKVAQDYFRYRQEQQVLLEINQTLYQEITQVEIKLKSTAGQLKDAQELYLQLNADYALSKDRLAQLCKQPFYQEVQAFSPEPSAYTYEVLADARRALLGELDGKQKDRGILVEKQKNAASSQQRLHQQMEEIIAQAELPIHKGLLFSDRSETELNRLRQELKAMKVALRELEGLYMQKNDDYQKASGAYDNQLLSYHKNYGELLLFAEPLTKVKERLYHETQRLKTAIGATRQTIESLRITLKGLGETVNWLAQKNELLHFTADAVEMAILAAQIEEKTPEELDRWIRGILEEAGTQYQCVVEKEKENQRYKDKFIGECQNKIVDERMKQVVLTGIRSKTAYLEFTDWHATIRERIAYSIRIAESERKEHYTHVEQIIGQVHTYLADVAEELKQIPKKTRIKIDESSKEFYVVHVPQWQEIDGKNIIRSYFDSITKRLEEPAFYDEFGKEKTKEIRSTLEKSMRTQQLLNQIIGENSIRVKCRKVTNNNQLSIGAYTWEESCRWSGGEKWSKNMALFLGCLNYLSEKGKNVKMTKSCNRVVIADNPFGQASSEHVLNPVFFIAKQLGFQFIALTAHDEGGFIRKYFPVVYSCRFAHTKDQKSQIIQTEKEIKTAFFKEDNPAAMERLTDYESIGLF